MTLFLVTLLIVSGAWVYWSWSRKETHKRLLTTPLSKHQHAILAEQVPLIEKLPPQLRKKLDGKINLFLNQVEFSGCNGLDVTEEMKLSIAAQKNTRLLASAVYLIGVTPVSL
nr:zinc-dependent peptidase [Marivita geojedonensis]